MSARYTGGLVYNAPGGWSAQFNGTTQYLRVSANTAIDVGSGDFTINVWALPFTKTNGVDNIFGYGNFTMMLYHNNTNWTLEMSNNGSSNQVVITSPVILNSWQYLTIVKSGTTVTLYRNAVSQSTGTISGAVNTSGKNLDIGANGLGTGQWFTGYISNYQLIKGTAVVPTIPSGALQPVSGTTLLTCRYPTFVDGSVSALSITNNGSTPVSTLNPFPTSALPDPALGGAGNGVYTMSQYAALKAANLWPAFDPFYKNVTLNLHGNGTNAAQNNTFLDSSTNNFTITRNGNSTQGTFTPYGSNWSNAFATNSLVRFPYTSALTSWWTQDFTMEMWIFNNTNAVSGTNSLALQFAHGIYTTASTYWAFGTNASGQVEFYYYNGSQNRVTSTTAALLGTWNHIAMVYTHSSGNISLYLNGVSVASATKSGTPQNGSDNTVNIGAVQGTYYNGYISNLRVLNGTALYTGTFTPPTTPLTAITNTQLLTCADNRFIDDSTNNATPTIIGSPSVQRFSPFASIYYQPSVIGGSGYFDGSGDYLSVADNAAFNLSGGDYTLEAWIYWDGNTSDYRAILAKRISGTGTTAWEIFLNTSTGTFCFFDGTIRNSGVTPPPNAWSHVAACWNNSTSQINLYVNGTRVLQTSATNTNRSADVVIGTIYASAGIEQYIGYMTDVRIVKGTQVYTGTTYTVPTAPLTAISGTSLLINYTNAAIIDNAMMNDLETVSNAQISTSVKKYGTGSMAFDGDTDYVGFPKNENVNLSANNFTIEFWAYWNTFGSDKKYVLSVTNGSNYWQFNHDSSVGVGFIVNSSSIFSQGSNSGWSTGTWYHVALVRNGSTLTAYRNGTSIASGSLGTSALTNYNNFCIGGSAGFPSTTMDGYIDDFRLTRGIARYTTNFTPPTSQLQDQ